MTCTDAPQPPVTAPRRPLRRSCAAAARLARRPAARITTILACTVAGVAAGSAIALLAGLLLLLAELATWRIRSARQAAARPRPWAPSPPVPPGPGDPDEAQRACSQILARLRPGPEQVIAADPAATPVRWDIKDWRDRDGQALNLPAPRADKMQMIRHFVRQAAIQARVLHQLPQLLLVADDGAVIELFGDRTGTIAPPAAGPGAAGERHTPQHHDTLIHLP